ncbi:hypothetical protein HMPREF9120_00872 [Neisseria sp. oral taxon 020 str. F0370]|nr:hypothetical protein HMPREF9120_00872 [Neisseria sp. oral taxon 020 str. F0370]
MPQRAASAVSDGLRGRLKAKIPPRAKLPLLRFKRGGGLGWGWQFAELHLRRCPAKVTAAASSR